MWDRQIPRTGEAKSNVVAGCVRITRRRVVPCTTKRLALAGCYSAVGAVRAKIPVHGVGGQHACHRVTPLVIDRPVRRPGKDSERKEESGPASDRRSS